MAGLRLTYVRFEHGERYPILLGSNGLPQWYPTLFATSHYRNGSRTAATTHGVLSSVRQVYIWSEHNDISLEGRFRERDFLHDFEISSLVDFLKRRAEPDLSPPQQVSHPSMPTLEQARALPSEPVEPLSSGYVYNRILVAGRFLKWVALRVLRDSGQRISQDIKAQIDQMVEALSDLRPRNRRNFGLAAKRAQPPDESQLTLQIAKPDHLDNPYSKETAFRNHVIFQLLSDLGLRSGELLALRTDDVDFQSQDILVARRHNDKLDPRARQPVAKTEDRRLPISDDLASALFIYIGKVRPKQPYARRHPFLFTTVRGSRLGQAGAPMSLQQLGRIVAALSAALPTGSMKLHPHLFRHNAATAMGKSLRERGVPEGEAERVLNSKFGWADGSKSFRVYIEQNVAELAAEAQMNMQERPDDKGNK